MNDRHSCQGIDINRQFYTNPALIGKNIFDVRIFLNFNY
jgi:hypothetical protein